MHMIVHVIECDTSLVQHAHAQIGNYKRYMILTCPLILNDTMYAKIQNTKYKIQNTMPIALFITEDYAL